MRLSRIVSAGLLAVGLAACSSAGRPDLSGMTFSEDPLVGKVIWYDLITEDSTASRRFYNGLFGWTFEETTGVEGNPYILARSGGVYVGGMVPVAAPADGSSISRWLPYMSVEDVDAAVIRTDAWGGSVAAAARDLEVGRVAAIIDPQGAVIGLARSDLGDPDDKTTAAAAGRAIWTELLADDDVAAAAFYASVVGFETSRIERRGGTYTLLSNGGMHRAGILKNPTDWKPAWLTHFAVSDPAAAAARAEQLGGRVLLPPTQEVREGTVAIVSDPSGAILALQKWPL